MIVVKKSVWRWLVFSVFMTACAVAVCAGLFFALRDSVQDNRALINTNTSVIDKNGQLIKTLQTQDTAKAVADAQERAKLRALRRSFLAFQAQVRRLGGTPQPLPPALQNTPDGADSNSASSARSPSPSATPRPTGSRTPTPGPTPRRSPSGSPTPTCRVPVGTVCLVP